MEDLILIKLGGSLITDKTKPFCAKELVIQRLGREINEARKKFSGKIIIGHGSGSFGHTVAAKYKTQDGLTNKNSVRGLSLVADAAVQINRIVIKNLLEAGLLVLSFAPASFVSASDHKANKVFKESILQAIEVGVIPVIYGDIILDKKHGCTIFSSEVILNILAKALRTKFRILRIIHCGGTYGVYDKKGQTIPLITPTSFKNLAKAIGKSQSTDVTGGMLHKVQECLEAAKLGIDSLIINGSVPGELEKAILENNKVTVVKAR